MSVFNPFSRYFFRGNYIIYPTFRLVLALIVPMNLLTDFSVGIA